MDSHVSSVWITVSSVWIIPEVLGKQHCKPPTALYPRAAFATEASPIRDLSRELNEWLHFIITKLMRTTTVTQNLDLNAEDSWGYFVFLEDHEH